MDPKDRLLQDIINDVRTNTQNMQLVMQLLTSDPSTLREGEVRMVLDVYKRSSRLLGMIDVYKRFGNEDFSRTESQLQRVLSATEDNLARYFNGLSDR